MTAHGLSPTSDVVVQTPFGEFRPGALALSVWWLATTRLLPRSVRKWFRKRLARNFPGPFDVETEGIRMRAWPVENRCDRVVVGRGELPESPERRLIEPLLKTGMSFVDVGANVGVYTLFVSARTGGSASVLALEPHPRTFAKLKCNCALGGYDNVRALNLAAGPQRNVATLFSDGGGNIGGASLLVEAAGDAKSVDVQIAPLAEILLDNGVTHIDLLKADIEGFEDRALKPLFEDQDLEHLWPKAVLLETVHEALWQDDLMALLKRYGYEVDGRTDENVLLRR